MAQFVMEVDPPAAPKITIKGKGFVNNGHVYLYFNGDFRASTYIASTSQHPAELQVQLQVDDVAKSGYYSIYLLNDVPGGCGAYAQKNFDVRAHPGKAPLKITKMHTGNFSCGEVGANYTLSVANSGGASTGCACAAGGETCSRNDVLNAGLSYGDHGLGKRVRNGTPQLNKARVPGAAQ